MSECTLTKLSGRRAIVLGLACAVLLVPRAACAQEPPRATAPRASTVAPRESAPAPAVAASAPASAEPTTAGPALPPPPGCKRLHPECDVWLDDKLKRVIAHGRVCLREGALELLACRAGTKEHESVVAIRTEAYVLHAALLAAGAEVGRPVEFTPEFRPPTGTRIDLLAFWTDREGERRKIDARQWIRSVRSGQALEQPWVFAGSGFWENPMTKQRHYLAEDGDLICVSNFPTAMLDLPVESSQANAELLFEAFTENIPPVDTWVQLVFIPRGEVGQGSP